MSEVFFCAKCDEETAFEYFPYEPSDFYNPGGPECWQCEQCEDQLYREDVCAD